MACESNQKPNTNCHNNNGYVCIVVLYILLAIIIGSCLFR